MKALCTEETPCIIVTRNQDVPDELLQASRESGMPLLRSFLKRQRDYQVV